MGAGPDRDGVQQRRRGHLAERCRSGGRGRRVGPERQPPGRDQRGQSLLADPAGPGRRRDREHLQRLRAARHSLPERLLRLEVRGARLHRLAAPGAARHRGACRHSAPGRGEDQHRAQLPLPRAPTGPGPDPRARRSSYSRSPGPLPSARQRSSTSGSRPGAAACWWDPTPTCSTRWRGSRLRATTTCSPCWSRSASGWVQRAANGAGRPAPAPG